MTKKYGGGVMKKALLIVGGGVLLVMVISATSASSTIPAGFPAKCLEKVHSKTADENGCLEKNTTNGAKTSELFLRELKKRERRVLA